jgi:hypothetical protein
MLGHFAEGIVLRLDGVLGPGSLSYPPPELVLPGWEHGRWVVLDVLNGPAPFEAEDFQAFLGEFLASPAAGDAGADDDGVVFHSFELMSY